MGEMLDRVDDNSNNFSLVHQILVRFVLAETSECELYEYAISEKYSSGKGSLI